MERCPACGGSVRSKFAKCPKCKVSPIKAMAGGDETEQDLASPDAQPIGRTPAQHSSRSSLKLAGLVVGVLAVAGIVGVVVTSLTERTIVGKWQELDKKRRAEYLMDGTVVVIVELDGKVSSVTGTYSFIDAGRIKLELSGATRILDVTITGDKMTNTNQEGRVTEWTRVTDQLSGGALFVEPTTSLLSALLAAGAKTDSDRKLLAKIPDHTLEGRPSGFAALRTLVDEALPLLESGVPIRERLHVLGRALTNGFLRPDDQALDTRELNTILEMELTRGEAVFVYALINAAKEAEGYALGAEAVFHSLSSGLERDQTPKASSWP